MHQHSGTTVTFQETLPERLIKVNLKIYYLNFKFGTELALPTEILKILTSAFHYKFKVTNIVNLFTYFREQQLEFLSYI